MALTYLKHKTRDFLSVQWLRAYPSSIPSQGTRSHIPWLSIYMIPHATTKTRHRQINIFLNKYSTKPNISLILRALQRHPALHRKKFPDFLVRRRLPQPALPPSLHLHFCHSSFTAFFSVPLPPCSSELLCIPHLSESSLQWLSLCDFSMEKFSRSQFSHQHLQRAFQNSLVAQG